MNVPAIHPSTILARVGRCRDAAAGDSDHRMPLAARHRPTRARKTNRLTGNAWPVYAARFFAKRIMEASHA